MQRRRQHRARRIKLNQPNHRIQSLDGLRAISIPFVLLGHLGGSQGFPRLDLGIGDYARLGVVVFFVISGYLITTLLENEWKKTGTVALGRFYIRRALRLLPAEYVYLICVFSLAQIGFINLTAPDFWHSVAYIVNYLPNRSWEIGHLVVVGRGAVLPALAACDSPVRA